MTPKQASLFDELSAILLERWQPHARSSDPWTSHAAAAEINAFAGNHCEMILAELKRHSSTQHEIAAMTGLNFAQVNKRLSDLEHKGLARKTAQYRRGPSGRKCLVWEAT